MILIVKEIQDDYHLLDIWNEDVMEKRLYSQMMDSEENHWWFVSRRKIIRSAINKYIGSVDLKAKILDAGCGTGGNLLLLSEYSKNTVGMEYDNEARVIAAQKSGVQVYPGSLPDQVPFPDESFDMIVILDVLEHIDNDTEALNVLRSKLKPGGHLLITVPAFKFLWSEHDDIHHHKRRYKLGELQKKLSAAGFKIKYSSYFNTFLFFPIAAVRLLKPLVPFLKKKDDVESSPKVINDILGRIMSSESELIKLLRLPFGVSIISVCQK